MKHLGLVVLLACGACLPAQPVVSTTIETRNPLAVDVVRVAPWNGIETHVAREPSGALVASSPGEPSQVLVSGVGRIVLDPDETVNVQDDPIATTVTYSAAGEGTRGTPTILSQLVLSTPRSNLQLVTENRRPAHGSSAVYIAVGTGFLAGAVASTYGAATASRPGVGAGFVIAATCLTAMAAYGIIEGLYRIFGTEEEPTVYRAPAGQ